MWIGIAGSDELEGRLSDGKKGLGFKLPLRAWPSLPMAHSRQSSFSVKNEVMTTVFKRFILSGFQKIILVFRFPEFAKWCNLTSGSALETQGQEMAIAQNIFEIKHAIKIDALWMTPSAGLATWNKK
jgi:hypothetical protein